MSHALHVERKRGRTILTGEHAPSSTEETTRLDFEGWKTFARDFGISSTAESVVELENLWESARRHQRLSCAIARKTSPPARVRLESSREGLFSDAVMADRRDGRDATAAV
ncbi:unnamed protein product, partial [Sphacelaria rigidula]